MSAARASRRRFRQSLPAAPSPAAASRSSARAAASRRVPALYRRLLAAFGPQGWWPGDGPFDVLVGAVLTQNTAWLNVVRAIERLKAAGVWDARSLDAISPRQLAPLLRPSGYFNVKARRLKSVVRWFVSRGASFAALAQEPTERLRPELLAVHGVGPETADSVLCYALGKPVFVVDAYTRRVFHRLGLSGREATYDELQFLVTSALKPDAAVYNELHALVVRLGNRICRPRPRCEKCPLDGLCPKRGARRPPHLKRARPS